jgi:hypothetical protein
MPDQDQTDLGQTALIKPLQVPFIKSGDFQSSYANNVQFQPNEIDMKLLFGEMDTSKMVIEHHTAITMTWLQAKLMLHFLEMQIHVYEMTHGRIQGSSAVYPPEPQPPTGELESDPTALKIYEYMKINREQFVESLK